MKKIFQQSAFLIFGFTAGILFLISCGGGSSSSNSVINTVNASLPTISDQMFCRGIGDALIGGSMACMKQSTGTRIDIDLASAYADGWILISISGDTTTSGIFYK